MSAVSSTFLSTLRHALREERHFALVEICQANLGLASNRSGQELSPTHASLRIEQDGEVPRGVAIDDASPGHRREAVGKSARPTSHHLRII
jgi:hypothetical protein